MKPISVFLIVPVFPYPPNQGVRVDIWSRIQLFDKVGYSVTMVVCGKQSKDNCALENLPQNVECHFVQRYCNWGNLSDISIIQQVQGILDETKPDIIISEYAHSSNIVNELETDEIPVAFRTHNFEYRHYRDKFRSHLSVLKSKRCYNPMEYIRWLRWYRGLINQVDKKERLMHDTDVASYFIDIAHADSNGMQKRYKTLQKRCVFPPPVQGVTKKEDPVSNSINVLFVGKCTEDNNPNTQGLYELVNRVVPAIEKHYADRFHFHIVGAGCKERFPESKLSPNITILGFVDDLDALIQSMDAACYPIRYGWGCKIKIVEAILSELPVVATNECFRGIEADGFEFPFLRAKGLSDYIFHFGKLLDLEYRRKHAVQFKELYLEYQSNQTEAFSDFIQKAATK